MKKVLVLGKIHNSGINFLKTNSYHVDELSDQNDLYKDKLESYDALIVKMTKVDNEFINHSKNLKIIARHGVGYNNIDLKIINSKKIPLFIVGDVNSTSVAEHTISLILNISKKINLYDQEIRLNNFNIRNTFQSRDLTNKKILICGYGRIGKKVADICKFFNMSVFVYDKYLDLGNDKNNFKLINNLNENMDIFDFITLHIPYNNSGKPLIDDNFLSKLKKNCSIINTSRGDLINENDLTNHLDKNKDFYAGLDVFDPEPPNKDSKILKFKNVVLTPHSAAYTEECLSKMSMYCAENINNFFNNNPNISLLINKEIYS